MWISTEIAHTVISKSLYAKGLQVIWAIVKINSMQHPTEEEFKESIKELSEYKIRLEKEVVSISQKLKMPHEKIKSIIKSHKEINEINQIISNLNKQKENLTSKMKS